MSTEKLAYRGQPNCYRLSNGIVDIIATTDIGPRVIRYGWVGGANVFGEYPQLATHTAWGDWKPWGGHRLWAAPEALPRTYAPDNSPIGFSVESDLAIRLMQPTDQSGIEKEMFVTLAAQGSSVIVHHKITNRSLWTIELAPWASTILRGGIGVLPLEPFRSHAEILVPAQPIVRWYFHGHNGSAVDYR